MTKLATMAVAAASATLLAGCAAYEDEPASGRALSRGECFYMSQVSGFNNAPDSEDGHEQIRVSAGPGDTYLFEVFGNCPDIDYSERIGFDKRGPGRICSGLDVDLIVPSSIGPQRCPVRMIRKLTPEERAAR